MALPNLSGSYIQDTYQRIVQYDGGGNFYDGTGSLLNSVFPGNTNRIDQNYINPTLSGSIIIQSGTIAPGKGDIVYFSSSVSASTYYGDGSNLTGISSDPFPYTGSAIITGSLEVVGNTNIQGDIIGTGRLQVLEALNNNVVVGSSYKNAASNQGASVVVGPNAMGNYSTSNALRNIAIGNQPMRFGQGSYNIAIGHSAAYNNATRGACIYIGDNAGFSAGGQGNVGLGTNALRGLISGDYNNAIGRGAGFFLEGNYNYIFGYEAGYNASGSKNVLLGYQAGYNLTGSNQLIIANTGSHALVTGDFANNTFNISGSVSASTYYGDGSNLSGISSTPFPFEGDAVITGSLTVSASFVDFSEATVVNIPNLESLSLVNPKVEYLDVTASISSGTSITLPNNLSYLSSSVYEYLEVFMNGLRLRYNRDFVPTSNTTIQNQMHFPSGSELTFKSLKR